MDIRPARSEDKPAIIATLRAAFGGWHGSESDAYWDWKFERNPHGRARIWVADDGGTIAGCYVWNPVRLRSGASIVEGAQSVDAAVHPGYQGRGVFTDLARAAIDDPSNGVELVYAFPTEGAFRGQLRVGFRDLFPLAKVYRPLVLGPRRRRESGAGLEFVDVAQFDSRFDVFAASRAVNGLSVARDAAYLRWRYAEHPSGAHETIACERDGDLRAYCVLKVEHEPAWAKPGYVVDLQALPDAADDARRLLTRGLARLRRRGSRVAVAWMPPPGAERDVLAASGFSPVYGAAWRKLNRPHFVDRFIAFDARRNGSAGDLSGEQWAVAPGDADYM